MPFEHEQPRRRGRPIKRAPATHVIHGDGTYSNAPTIESKPSLVSKWERPAGGSIFKTKTGAQYIVMDERDWGLFIYNYPYKYQPRVDDCMFWDNKKLEEEIG